MTRYDLSFKAETIRDRNSLMRNVWLGLMVSAASFSFVPSLAMAGKSVVRCQAALIEVADPFRMIHSESPFFEFQRENGESNFSKVRAKGPFGQPMAVRQGGGLPPVFGTKKAVERARRDAGELKEPLFDFSLPEGKDSFRFGEGEKEATIELVPAIAGSAVTTKAIGDFDAEILIVGSYRRFALKDFFTAESPLMVSAEKTLRLMIQSNLKKGYVFSDFKAGEFDFVPKEAESTRSRAIKWKLEEILQGYKMIPQGHENGPLRKLTLREAMASPSRVKIDWMTKVQTTPEFFAATGLRFRYMEYSMLVAFAGKRPGGTAVLRTNEETQFPELGATGGYLAVDGRASEVPVRATTIFFKEEHMDLARQATVSTSGVDLRHFNTMTINTVKTHMEHRHYFKLIRMLFTRLHYWNDLAAFQAEAVSNGAQLHPRRLLRVIEQINADSKIRELYVFAEAGKALASMRVLKVESAELAKDIKEFMSRLSQYSQKNGENFTGKDLESAIDFLANLINQRTLRFIDSSPELKQYLEYVTSLPYAKEFESYDHLSSFLALKIPVQFVDSYRERLSEWKNKYPDVPFTLPQDLHMTLAYIGEVPSGKKADLRTLTDSFHQKIQGYELNLSDGVLQVVGRNNSQLAVVFDVSQLPPAFVKELVKYKTEVYRLLGIRPEDRDLTEFLPHISVAHVRDMMGDGRKGRQIPALLLEDLKGIDTVSGKTEVHLLYVEEAPASSGDKPRYRQWGVND